MIPQLALAPAALWAAEGSSTGDATVDALLKGGPFAIVLLLIIMDKLGTNSERDRLREDNKSLREQNQQLNDTVRTEVVPPLTELNLLMAETLNILSDEDRFPPRKRTPARRT